MRPRVGGHGGLRRSPREAASVSLPRSSRGRHEAASEDLLRRTTTNPPTRCSLRAYANPRRRRGSFSEGSTASQCGRTMGRKGNRLQPLPRATSSSCCEARAPRTIHEMLNHVDHCCLLICRVSLMFTRSFPPTVANPPRSKHGGRGCRRRRSAQHGVA